MPVTTGANAGPNVIMQPPMDMNWPRRCFGVTARIVFIIIGMNSPLPHACTTRASSSTGKFGENRPISEPAVVSATPT